ncbi:poly A polymerase [Bdellovibrio bacteriovorus]|uniref:Poly A polymerase n=1 Tax=Bdellovibrio bacteriovorus TaxID=959 RepID=A0A150WK36_BDEBC|nr:CCA tRNA nucleotidyltransferase [Bdellovibrio bacteriovorus]KYG64082.1 poly A polymerase [Bdellovibrio bacteriovorus]
MATVQSILETHPHWPAVEDIYHKLGARGYKAFLAGGCVRDALLGISANDLDVATDATPEEIEKIFANTVAVGKSFGVMRVLIGDADIEVATFRSDGEYKDGRRPEGVHFSTPEMDAQRRDFTVNALFYDLNSQEVLDFVQGKADLAKKTLRTVGDAEKRFAEDHLRLLRAARFVGQLDFALEVTTFAALKRMAPKVMTVSGERLHEEMGKLLRTAAVQKGLDVLVSSGLMAELFPFRAEDANGEYLSLAHHTWQSFALFFRQAPLTEVKSQLARLRFSVKEQRAIERVWGLWHQPEEFFKLSLAKQLLKMSEEGVPWALTILKAQKKFLSEIDLLTNAWAKMGETLPKPFLSGTDVQGLQGKAIGDCLAEAFELQLEHKHRSREEALEWLKSYKKKA